MVDKLMKHDTWGAFFTKKPGNLCSTDLFFENYDVLSKECGMDCRYLVCGSVLASLFNRKLRKGFQKQFTLGP